MPEGTRGRIPQTDEFGRTPFAASLGTGSHNDLDFGSLCVRRTVVRRASRIASKPELLRKPLGRGSRSPGPETAHDRPDGQVKSRFARPWEGGRTRGRPA